MMKRCSKCGIEKDEKEFYKNNRAKDKLCIWCKECDKAHKHDNLDKIRTYCHNNAERIRAVRQSYWRTNSNKMRQYRQHNATTINTSRKQRRDNDYGYRMSCVLRSRLYKALFGNFKHGSAVRDLGCSRKEFDAWIESQFQPGMTWANYGTEWQIDHIIPFKFIDETQYSHQRVVCHYKNLRPMWKADNLSRTYDDIPSTPAIDLVWYL